MLTELCQYLKNWFELDQISGEVTISGNGINVVTDSLIFGSKTPTIQLGQYIRIIGSAFNDGVIQYGSDELVDETFDGAIWLLGIPRTVIELADEISEWRAKYETVASHAMSPFNSESFKGYSYSKSTGSGGSGSESALGWQNVFGPRLAPWRKI